MIRRRLFLMILFQLLLLLPISTVHGFANYLLSRSQCITELSTDEAIMNAMVVAASDSVDPTMRIEVVIKDEDEDITVSNNSNDPGLTVILVKTVPVTLALRVVSSAIPKNDDFQWVMDVLVPSGEDASPTAAFVQGGCDGQWRVAGRGPNEAVTLTIHAWGNTTVLSAWALSYGPVTLTEPLVLTVESSAVDRGAMAAPKQPRTRGVSQKNPRKKEEEPQEQGNIEWMLIFLLLLLAITLLGVWWWYRIRPRFMKRKQRHL